jgi:hypothetical protein
MFTFAAWPATNPGADLTWGELRHLERSGMWSVQEHGGHGHEDVIYNAAGDDGGVYAFRQYIAGRPDREATSSLCLLPQAGHVEHPLGAR